MGLLRWEPALRALYTGRPIYDPESFSLQAADGASLDPTTSFALDSEADAMREFLNAAGYLLVKDVFQETELAQFRGAAEEIAGAAREGDQQSWWGKNAEGQAVLSRCLNFSIYLYDATEESGPLQFLPGSHRFGFGFADASLVDIPNAVTVPARAGDITLHVSDVMHAAPSPFAQKGPHRQSVLLVYTPDFQHHQGERHYNDVLLGDKDGQISHLQSKVGETK